MAPYQYEPLKEAAKEIRLMTVLAGNFSDDIHISIQRTSFLADGSSADPMFEALSYTWGSTDNPVNITIHGGAAKTSTLAITHNLATALPYLRHGNRDRVLWIDAICVNQHDLAERSSQVQRMAEIYSRAKLTIAWLGPDHEECGHALLLLGSMGSRIEVDWVVSKMAPVVEDNRNWADHTKPLPYSTAEYTAIYNLLSRSWFERIWIRQEIQLANTAVLVCGFSVIPWISFRKAIFCLGRRPGYGDISGLAERIDFLKDLVVYGHTYEPLGSVIYGARHCKCSDPKDRVYAVLGLLHEYDKKYWAIKPDYTSTICQTYENVAFSYMEVFGSLRMLQFCDIGNRNPELALPSWVPDWSSMGNAAEPIQFAMAHCSWPGQYQRSMREGGRLLEAKGVDIDSIVDVIELRIVGNEKSFWTDVMELQRVATCNTLTNMYVGNGRLVDALCRTFCMDNFRELYEPPPSYLVSEKEGRFAFSKLLGGPSKSFKNDVLDDRGTQLYLSTVFEYAKNRSFLITKAGYIGLAPKATRPGDRVCVLLGCASPLVIRPVGADSIKFQVVGEAYVDSAMSGEAFLGPLPDHYRYVAKFDIENGYHREAFFDRHTLKTQWEDPRWKYLLGEDYEQRLELNGMTKKNKEAVMRTEALKARGVELRWFELV